MARAGWPAEPQFDTPLALPHPTRLGWDEGFFIGTRIDVIQDGRKLGYLQAEKRLAEIEVMSSDVLKLGNSARLNLCAAGDGQSVRCFPARKGEQAANYSRQDSRRSAPMHWALAGKAGFITEREGRYATIAYMPMGALGLGAVLRIDGSALNQELRQQGRFALPLILLLLGVAALAMRLLVMPKLRQLQASEKHARELNQQLQRNEERIRAVLNQVDEGIVSITSDGRVHTFNPAAERMFGYTEQEVLGNNIAMLMLESEADQRNHDLQQYLESEKAIVPGASLEVNGRRKDGTFFPIQLRLGEVKLEGEHLFIATMRDIAEVKAVEARMTHLASHDSLTNLPNRHLLQDRARQALLHAARQQRRIGILFLDLDHFKSVNDLLGHPMGDRLLQTVTARILNCVRNEDTVARQGGDEFIVILPNIKRFEDVAIIAQKILVSLSAPYAIDNTELHTSASIGAAVFPDDGKDVETLMRNADTAMYYAKATGRNNFQFFTPKMNQAVIERMGIESKLRHALSRKEFSLHYQPIVNLATGQVSAAEALLRWQPDSGPISPDRFIPVAEETGLIIPIGEWVIRTALQERRRWLEQGLTAPRMVVNMSARQFAQKNLVATLGRLLQEIEISPEQLGLEITESLLMERPDEAVRTLRTLSGMGVQISIDDFGTGYSSLSYLKRFPLDKIKIDRSFIRHRHRSGRCGHRHRDYRHGAQPQHHRGRRGGGNGGATAIPARAWLR